MICTRWVENLSVSLRSPSAGSPDRQTTRSIDVSHAESALVQLGDALGHRSCQNQRKTIRRANLPTRSHTSPMARAQAGGVLGMSFGSLTHLLSSGRPSWQIGATLRPTAGAKPANPVVQESLILRGFLEAALLWRRGREKYPEILSVAISES